MNLADIYAPISAIADDIVNAVGGYFKSEDDKTKAKAEISQALIKNDNVQGMVTLAESQSDDKFKSRWRPALGWICVTGLGMHAIIFPIVQAVMTALGQPWAAPNIDVTLLVGLISTLLGLGSMRTVEKINGAS